MHAYELRIDAKVKQGAFGLVSVDDFRFHEGAPVDPKVVVEQSTISLYCLDHARQRAIFVETPPEADLFQAPFYFQAQYDNAQRLIAVPYDTLHLLAEEVQIDPSHIIFVHSTGRCGSTLVSHALNQADGVVSFSEPDVFTQLVALRGTDHRNDATLSTLVQDVVKVMCVAAQCGGASTWAFKFRSYVIEIGDLLFQAFPEAKTIFLYREATAWAQSFARAFPVEPGMLETSVQGFSRKLIPRVDAYYATHTVPISYMELFACAWVSVMERCRELLQQGAPIFCARYDHLKQAPRVVLDELLAFCGLTVGDSDRLEQVIARDSQAGTTAARTLGQPRPLSDDDIIELKRLIRFHAPNLAPDTLLADSFVPADARSMPHDTSH